MPENEIWLTAGVVYAGNGERVLLVRKKIEALIKSAGLKPVYFHTSSSRLRIIEVYNEGKCLDGEGADPLRGMK